MKSALTRLHIAIFLWGFTGVLGKVISLNGGWLVWWRMFITVISMWILFSLTGKLRKISRKDLLQVGFIGTLLALHWLCFYSSIKYANVSVALTCLSTAGLMSAILEPLYFRRRVNPKELLLGFFALIGIALVYLSNLSFSTGIYIGLLASAFSVSVSILNKKIVNNYKPETITLYQLSGGFIGLSLMMPLYQYLFPSKLDIPSLSDFGWLILLSWVCTIFTMLLYFNALKSVSAFTANLSLTMEPVYGIILAFVIFKENKHFGFTFYIGFALILIAVIIQMRTIVKKEKEIIPAME
jgi:drug/metabolite transporter (DMT)-like permease